MHISGVVKNFKVWLARRRLRRYGLRLATVDDLNFIMAEVIDGARDGHYDNSLLDPDHGRGFREQLENVIKYSEMVRWSSRGAEQITAQLWVYGSQADDQVGYLLASEKLPGSYDSKVELYLTGVRKTRRGLGHGRRIAQLFVAFTPPTVNLYARCFTPSQAMFLLLQGVGFSHTNTTPGGTRELELCRT